MEGLQMDKLLIICYHGTLILTNTSDAAPALLRASLSQGLWPLAAGDQRARE